MRQFVLVLAMTFNVVQGFAQFDRDTILKHYPSVSLQKVDRDTFLLFSRTNTKRPTIIFISGSGFLPLFVNGGCIATPFNPYPYLNEFNFVVLNKSGIPVFADSISNPFLNTSIFESCYRDGNGNIPTQFANMNNSEDYVRAYLHLIEYLRVQPWVDRGKIIVVGHSQGTDIALQLSLKTTAVHKLVLMSPGSPFNRFYEFIREIRQLQSFQQITATEAQRRIDSIYLRHAELIANKDNRNERYDAFSFQSYYSFVYPARTDLMLETRQKALVTYGTESVQDLECDYLPIFLSNHGKSNFTIKAYPGYDHNYFENVFDASGNFLSQKFHWDDVMADVIKWIKQ